MKILYLPCHSILEFDEVKLLTELGHEVFSMGSYINPSVPHDLKRPPIEGKYDDHLVSVATRYSKDNLHPDLIEPFDVIIVQHIPEWIINNWEIIKHKKVIWRTIGQSTSYIETQLAPYWRQGLRVVRYSPKEENIAFNIGTDAVIRFYKDPDEYKDWNGLKNETITVAQSMKRRGEFCHYDVFDEITTGFDRKLYGADNADSELWGGQLSYEELKAAYRDNRSFIYTGTQPASYTLSFIEAMMTGIPIVSVGEEIGNSVFRNEMDSWEIPDIIQNAQNGYISNNIDDLRNNLAELRDNHELARKIGEAGRQTAIELFGKEKIKQQWKEFLDTL